MKEWLHLRSWDGTESWHVMDAMGEPCPHCGSLDVDRGFTGLDQCNACSGLSRNGKTLTEVEAQFERDGDDTEELSRLNGLFKKLRKK